LCLSGLLGHKCSANVVIFALRAARRVVATVIKNSGATRPVGPMTDGQFMITYRSINLGSPTAAAATARASDAASPLNASSALPDRPQLLMKMKVRYSPTSPISHISDIRKVMVGALEISAFRLGRPKHELRR
jgi:hypothetical protein